MPAGNRIETINTDHQSEQEFESKPFESNPKEENDSSNDSSLDSSLEALVRQEQSDAREHLHKQLGREPTPEETDRWLSEQTEGY